MSAQCCSIQLNLVKRPGNIDAPRSSRILPSARVAPEELHNQIHTDRTSLLVCITFTLVYNLTTLKVRGDGRNEKEQHQIQWSHVTDQK